MVLHTCQTAAAFAVQATGRARIAVRVFQVAATAVMPITLAVLTAPAVPAVPAVVMVGTVAQAMAAVVVAGIDLRLKVLNVP